MDAYRELGDRLRGIAAGRIAPVIIQGIVQSVEGALCAVEVEGLTIPEVRLRASAVDTDGEIILVPAVGSVVLVGTLTGDLSDLAVLSVDKVERIRITGEVIINEGKLGGLVNIKELTEKINELVRVINTHTHTSATQGSPTTPPLQKAQTFNASDYEDRQVKH